MRVRDKSDSALWRHVTRDIAPLAGRRPPAPAPRPKPGAEPQTPRPIAPLVPATRPRPLDSYAGLDRANAERLKRGRHPIEARLDLHGMTQDEAHGSLLAFIRGARAAGKRCVLVITGRGSFGGGVLKAAVPRWFEEPAFRSHLLAIAPAQPRDGGAGALYVMLRRNAINPDR